MTKEEFIIQYVLNRSNTRTEGMDGKASAIEARKAWDQIQESVDKTERYHVNKIHEQHKEIQELKRKIIYLEKFEPKVF